MKRGFKVAIGVVIAAAALFMFLLWVSEDQVIVERMVTFEKAEPNSQVVWKDRETVRAFKSAFRFGLKQPGMVDVTYPPYAVTLGYRRYFLWVADSDDTGFFMKAGDTGTLYKLRESSSAKLQALLERAYSVSGESPAPIPVLPSAEPDALQFTPAYLDSKLYSEAERPLIELINLRVKYMHEGNRDKLLELYTDFARKARESTGSFNGFTVTSIKAEGEIAIKEQKALFEAVVEVTEAKDNGEGSRSLYVFQKGKEQDAEWRIADVD
ncbi:hypothetical protein [Paenibacillus sp. LPE1-1-1.1]|uniref:hypothetical protein n=1 Tax=Paenibacillus sp. LPE1-1-1.1 TaxID=3135230 RepID=UPI003425FC46